MKQCPKCGQVYIDDSLNFCLDDGSSLVQSLNRTEEETVVLSSPKAADPPHATLKGVSPVFAYLAIGVLALLLGGGIVAFLKSNDGSTNSPSGQNIPVSQNTSIQQIPTVGTNTIAANQKTSPAASNPALISSEQPTSDYSTKGVRAGTADGRRLRVVVDLNRTSLNTGEAVRSETLADGGQGIDTRIFVKAQNDSYLNVKYESKAARMLGTVSLSPSGEGLEVRVSPRKQLFLKEVFFIPRSSSNPNDRLVIDLCLDVGCPSLRR